MDRVVVVSEEQKKIMDDIDHAMAILMATECVLLSSDLVPEGVHTLHKGARTYIASLSESNTVGLRINNAAYKIHDAISFVRKVLAKEDVTNDLNEAMFATYDENHNMTLIKE